MYALADTPSVVVSEFPCSWKLRPVEDSNFNENPPQGHCLETELSFVPTHIECVPLPVELSFCEWRQPPDAADRW